MMHGIKSTFRKSMVLAAMLALATTFSLTATAPVFSQGAVQGGPEGVPAPVPPLPKSTESEVIGAAASGDPELMRRLVGRAVELEGRATGTIRDTKAYRDFLVTTGPNFRLGGGELAVEVIVRVPTQLNMRDIPPNFRLEGNITDFEPQPREGQLIHWLPVVTISTLR
jgi:hypothetical protein